MQRFGDYNNCLSSFSASSLLLISVCRTETSWFIKAVNLANSADVLEVDFMSPILLMKSIFSDARTRIDWAKKDTTRFERCAKAFFQRTPYSLVTEPDPDGVHEFHKFRLAKNLPAVLTKHTVSAIENLRSALDLAAAAVARLVHAPDLGEIHFPFCKANTDFKSRVNSSACKPLPDEVKTLFGSFKPYGGGNDILWAVNELCNTSKHRLIFPVAAKGGVHLPLIETSDLVHAPIILMEGLHDCAENEVVFAKTQLGLKWKYRLQIAFGIAFGKVEAVEGKEVYPTLLEMHRVVTEIVDATEAECHGLKLM